MNKTTIINNIKRAKIAGENIIFINTDDTPRILSIIDETFPDNTGVIYSKNRHFHDPDDQYSSDTRNFDSFKQMLSGAGDIEEDILILKHCHDKLDDGTIDVLHDISISYCNTFLIFIVPNGYVLPRELDNLSIFQLSNPDNKEIEELLFNIFKNKSKIFNKLDLDKLIESLLGLPEYEIKRFFTYQLSEHENDIKRGGTQYLISCLESRRTDYINSIQGLSLVDTKDVVIGGYDSVKSTIKELSETNKLISKGFKLDKAKGVLLHGLAGVGKTQFAKYISNTFNNTLLEINIPSIYDKWQGVSETKMNTILNFIDSIGNCTVLIDEVHLLFDMNSKSEESTNRLLSMLLTYMQNNNKNIFFVFTANDISSIPPQLMRKGRLDYVIEIPLPDKEARVCIAKSYLELNDFDINLDIFKNISEGLTGADIKWYIEKTIINNEVAGDKLTEEKIIETIKNK